MVPRYTQKKLVSEDSSAFVHTFDADSRGELTTRSVAVADVPAASGEGLQRPLVLPPV